MYKKLPQAGKILITGSSGMLGADLVLELKKSHEVYGADLVNGSQLTVHRFEKCDITDKKKVAFVIKKVNPDIVIHAAAWTDVDGCELDPKKAYKINTEGTKNVASACKATGAILIYISTDFVFDGKKIKPYTEKDRPSAISVYGDSKLKGELAVKKSLKYYYILRTSWLYGKNGKNFVDTIITSASSGRPARVVDDQIGSPTYSKDLAKAIHVLIDKSFSQYSIRNTQYGTYHISNSDSVSWYEYAKAILKPAGSSANVLPISSDELDRPARRPAMSVLDNGKFVKFSGYRMRRWQDALKDYLKER